jgi:hypothetical protein
MATDPDDAWEKMRHLTLDQLVTTVKLQGSAVRITGMTTPEKWPFVLVVGVGKPGNELVLKYIQEFDDKMEDRVRWYEKDTNPRSFTCRECRRISFGRNAEAGFCDYCHKWTGMQ